MEYIYFNFELAKLVASRMFLLMKAIEDRLNLATSKLISRITNLQLELPTLEGEQHAAEIFPGDFPTIDNDEWCVINFGIVPLDSPSHGLIGNLKSSRIVHNMLDGKGSTYFLDQAAQQAEQIVVRVADHLELIAGRDFFSKLKGFQRDNIPQQARLEVELVCFASAVS
jgi:hypothetical protein